MDPLLAPPGLERASARLVLRDAADRPPEEIPFAASSVGLIKEAAMLIKKPDDIGSSEITPERLYLRRREFLAGGAALAVGALGLARAAAPPPAPAAGGPPSFANLKKGAYTVDEPLTSLDDVTHYNNFYEFGTDKGDPAENAKNFRARPWTVTVDGEVKKPQTFDVDQLIKMFPLEERVYRMRCVEAWSMVIPWDGFSLAELVKKMEPTGKAKFIQFTSLKDPEQMPGQKNPFIDWPYVEGLRIDEATHPLALLAVGLYGKVLPNQNGAPLRLVTPWKYGFKGGKSIVRITFRETQPDTTWNKLAPSEYGFYANVNPNHDHPRWSQAKERRIGELSKRKTLMFNGYADQVASLYKDLDLDKFY
jgi:sulfoxide reductase catalytic subunit YedY